MFKNKLANYETYSKTLGGNYDLDSSYTCYEVYIEVSHDKDGNVIKNRDGSDRYHALDDNLITKLEADKKVKVIREGFYKDVYEVNGDIVEKVQRNDGSHVYYVVDAEKVIELKAGTMVIAKNGTYRVPGEIGYVLVDDREIEKPRIVRVGKFKTEDHKAEAEQLVRGRRKPQEEQE